MKNYTDEILIKMAEELGIKNYFLEEKDKIRPLGFGDDSENKIGYAVRFVEIVPAKNLPNGGVISSKYVQTFPEEEDGKVKIYKDRYDAIEAHKAFPGSNIIDLRYKASTPDEIEEDMVDRSVEKTINKDNLEPKDNVFKTSNRKVLSKWAESYDPRTPIVEKLRDNLSELLSMKESLLKLNLVSQEELRSFETIQENMEDYLLDEQYKLANKIGNIIKKAYMASDLMKSATGISREQNQLYLGIIMGHLGYVLNAIENGAEISGDNGKALELAAGQGRFKMVKFLVEHGANPAANDDAAIKAAKKSGEKFIAEYLEKLISFGDHPLEDVGEIEIKTNRELKKDLNYPEELSIAGLRKFLINKFGKEHLYGIIKDKEEYPKGFYPMEKNPSILTSDFGWTLVPEEGKGYKVFKDKELVGFIKSLEEIAF